MNRHCRKMLFFCFTLSLIAVSASAEERVVASEGVVRVKAVIGEMLEVDVRGGIASVVRSGDPASVKVERVADKIFMTPLAAEPADIVVIDRRGKSFCVKFVMGTEAEMRLVLGQAPTPQGMASEGDMGAFLKSMVYGKAPEGTTASDVNKTIFDNGRIQLCLLKVYEGPTMQGYAMEAKNISPGSTVLPLQELRVLRLKAVSAEKEVLSAKGTSNDHTKVYAIVGKE